MVETATILENEQILKKKEQELLEEELYLQKRDYQWKEQQRELREDTRKNLKESLKKDMMKGVSAKDEQIIKK